MITEDGKSLLTADRLGNKENFENLYWEAKTWETYAGEVRTRIFVLLGSNSVGRMFILLKEFSRAGIVCQHSEELSEAVVWLVVRL